MFASPCACLVNSRHFRAPMTSLCADLLPHGLPSTFKTMNETHMHPLTEIPVPKSSNGPHVRHIASV